MENTLITYLKSFGPVPETDYQLILDAFEMKSYQEGEVLFESGRICNDFYFINKGILMIAANNELGNHVTHYFLKEHHFCTVLFSYVNQVRAEVNIEAACDVEVMQTKRIKLLQLYDKLPYLRDLVEQILQQNLMEKIQNNNAYQGHDSTARYKLFLALQPEVAARVSLGNIASYLRITQQSLSRIRKNMH
ncbi:Crp/Fnr family transcriptional regulator [Pedobacter antarcticus]|uniref:Crp/Fnr family transcriptional regulator n=1 Tax=Pedobacter antarcticus TaxID=34086 RepID=UPI001C580A0E|nr:Crp/Fnr family transcriptional regulator [Pedobacter antarcticus]